LSFISRYILRHIRRSAVKSALAALLAALLLTAIGMFTLLKQSYSDIFENTLITANFANGMLLGLVDPIMNTGCVKEPYYAGVARVDLNMRAAEVFVTNDIARFIGEEPEIVYADGFDASCAEEFGEVLIVGKKLAESYGVELGDTIQLNKEDSFVMAVFVVHAKHNMGRVGVIVDADKIISLYFDEIMEAARESARTYTIAGIVTAPSGRPDDMAFTPGVGSMAGFGGEMFKFAAAPLDVAEFTLADNMRADEFREYGERLALRDGTIIFIMDTSKLENPRNTLRLLDSLYTVAVAAALLIGAFLCCLVILQSSKEAAIMRVLGTTKRKTRVILALEQVLLSIVGLFVGVCGLLIYRGRELAVIVGQLSLFAILYFSVILVSAVICSGLATRRSALELLQVKE